MPVIQERNDLLVYAVWRHGNFVELILMLTTSYSLTGATQNVKEEWMVFTILGHSMNALRSSTVIAGNSVRNFSSCTAVISILDRICVFVLGSICSSFLSKIMDSHFSGVDARWSSLLLSRFLVSMSGFLTFSTACKRSLDTRYLDLYMLWISGDPDTSH